MPSGDSHSCQICRADQLDEIEEYASLPRFTSDTNPLAARRDAPNSSGIMEKRGDQSVVRRWYLENGWSAWAATIAILTLIAVIGVEIGQGYDLSPILWLVAFYSILAVVIGGGSWFFTKTRVGVAIGKVLGAIAKTIVSIACVLAVGAVVIWLGAVLLGFMRDECRQYSDFSCSYLEKATYSVQFGYPRGDRVETIGTAQGLAACGNIARSYATSRGMADAPWSYVCCLHAKDSTCYEKHR